MTYDPEPLSGETLQKIETGIADYFLSETTNEQGKPGVGLGLGKRGAPDQKITVYFDADSIADYLPLVEQQGGKVVMPRMPVPGYGALAVSHGHREQHIRPLGDAHGF